MEENKKVFFVRRPRIAEDLCVPHCVGQEKAYEIVKSVSLSCMDYKNFITDMLADRQFIEDNAQLCAWGNPCKCILVKAYGKTGGVLVVPENECFVGWAAYLYE